MMGELGLNTVPSARMSPEGTLRFTVSRQSPYTHTALGLQISDKLYLGFRQTSESDSFSSDTLHLYPGMDAKLELFAERRWLPQISVGIQSAFGHKRMAAEYLALSKRYENFDFTLGLGWGRLATRNGLPNPIAFNHLRGDTSRDIDGEDPNTPEDWFQGDMGLYGGFEYHTPVSGLSFKADINSDGWKAEKQSITNFNTPAPWSVGLVYQPWDWVDVGLAYAGNTVMTRMSFTPNISRWTLSDGGEYDPVLMQSGRPDPSIPQSDEDDDDFQDEDIQTEQRLGLSHIFIEGKTAEATLTVQDNQTTPKQIGEAARYIANISGDTPEQIIFHVRRYGLKGIDMTLNRSDLERAFLTHQGSSEEIWHSTEFKHLIDKTPFAQIISEVLMGQEELGFKIDVINDVSLSEEDSGLLYRTGLVASLRKFFSRHFLTLQSLRINLADNLAHLNDYRSVDVLPVRGDIDLFTQNRVLLDRNFLTGFVTLGDDIHFASSVGYLEEMYMGLSHEVLYRPFEKNWAVGVEAAFAFKRDPYTFMAMGPNGDHILTGFLNGYYEIPGTGATFKASIGRYLAGDIGGSLSLQNEFKNGVMIKGDISATNQSDTDVYGGKTNFYTGLRLSLPLGSLPIVPDGSRIITNAAPLGRDKAQRLDNPVSLYDITEPLSYRHITRQWSQLMP